MGPKGQGISVEEMALDVGQATLAATNLLTWRLMNWSLQRGKRKGLFFLGGGLQKVGQSFCTNGLGSRFASLYGRATLDSLDKLSKRLDGAFPVSKRDGTL